MLGFRSRWFPMSTPFYKTESSLSTNMRKNIDKVKIVLVYNSHSKFNLYLFWRLNVENYWFSNGIIIESYRLICQVVTEFCHETKGFSS